MCNCATSASDSRLALAVRQKERSFRTMANDNAGSILNVGPSLGILITAREIVAVQARSTRGRIEVLARGEVETPRRAVDEAAILDPSRAAHALRALKRQMAIRDRSASVALFSPGYSMRSLRLPEAPTREQRVLVRGELEGMAALPVA